MKTSNKTLLGAVALVAIILSGAYSFSSAYRGDYTKKGPNYTEEKHQAMEKAFENNDYNAWKEQMGGRGRVSEVVNEDNFSKFAEAHKLAENKKYVEADAIRKDLGLRTRDGERAGAGYGNKNGHKRGQMNNGNRGQNQGGNFVDTNGDGICDNLNK